MAREYDAYLGRGATVAAVVTDAPGQNAAMAEKLALPFPVLSDPDGRRAIKPFGVWDEASAMAKPAIVVLAPDGGEAYRYVGVDFVDRPSDDDVLEALGALGLPLVEQPMEMVSHLFPAPGPRAVRLSELAIYLRGVRFAMTVMAERFRDAYDRAEAERTAAMAERFMASIAATRRLTDGRAGAAS
jgi:hypothetical protein